MPKSSQPGGGGTGGLGFIVPGRGGAGHPGKRRRNRGGGGPNITFGIGGWDFSFGIAWGLPRFVLSRRRPAPRRIHPLHFAPPGLPGVIAEICQANPKVCFPPAVGASAGPFGLFGGALIGITLYGLQKEAEREAEKKRKRALDAEQADTRARERLNRIYSRVQISPMQPEFPPYYDYPQPVPLIGRPARARPARPELSPDVFPQVSPVEIPAPELSPVSFPSPLPLPAPEIAPPRPVVRPTAPVQLPVEFPAWPGTRILPWTIPGTPFAQPLPGPPTELPALPGVGTVPGMPGLTPFNPTGLPSRFAAPDTMPKSKFSRGECECPDTKTKRKKKRTECEKGLYRQRADSITYRKWSKIDCITGREI